MNIFFHLVTAQNLASQLDHSGSQRQIEHAILPLARLTGFRDEFQIANVLLDGSSFRRAENEAGELPAAALPLLGHRSKANIVSEDYAIE